MNYIKVIMWLPKVSNVDVDKSLNVGHLSLELSDGFYISFWPEKQFLWKKPCQGYTYEDDCMAQGRQPDRLIHLPPRIVDQNKIKHWWVSRRVREEYNLVFNNCSSVVREALRKGGIYEGSHADDIDAITCRIDTPFTVYSWVGVCKNLYLYGDHGISEVRKYIQSAENTASSWWNWFFSGDFF